MTGGQRRRRKQLLDDLKEKRMLETETGRTRSQSVEEQPCKKLWREGHTSEKRRKGNAHFATPTQTLPTARDIITL